MELPPNAITTNNLDVGTDFCWGLFTGGRYMWSDTHIYLTMVRTGQHRKSLKKKEFTKFISSGDSESPVTAPEVDHDAETFDNYHSTNPDHGQGVFASSWRAGSEQD